MELIENRLDRIESILEQFAEGLLKIEANLAKLEANLTKLEANLGKLESNVAKLEANLAKLESNVTRLEANLEKLEANVTRLEARTEKLEEDVEKLYNSVKELREIIRESNIRSEKEIEELKNSIKESNLRSEREIEELKNSLKESSRRSEREIKKMKEQWGHLSNKLGTLVEDIVFPASRPVLESHFKCKINDISPNREIIKGDLEEEFDVLAISDECKTVFLIEAKSKIRTDHVKDIKEKMERFRMIFDNYRDYKLIPILASLNIPKNIVKYLTRQGIYAMAYKEWEYMDILNFDELDRR